MTNTKNESNVTAREAQHTPYAAERARGMWVECWWDDAVECYREGARHGSESAAIEAIAYKLDVARGVAK